MEKKERSKERSEGVEKRLVRGDSILEFHSNRSVVVEGCRGILEYSEGIIRVSTRRMNLRFEGRNLEVISMSSDAIAIEGYILLLAFET